MQAVVSDTNHRSEKCGWEVRLVEETQGERNWTWVLSNAQVKAITRGTKRLLQVVLRDQDTLSAQASKVNSDIKRSKSSTEKWKTKWPCRRLNRRTKLRVCLLRFDSREQRECRGLFVLHDPSGFLGDLICSHGGDMLGHADVKLEELDKLIGSRQEVRSTADVSTRNTQMANSSSR